MSQQVHQQRLPEPAAGLRDWFREQGRAYRNGEDRPLAGYLMLSGGYATGTVAGGLLAKLLGRRLPDRLGPWEVAQLAIATHRLARTIAKDPVTSPFRAPFTSYAGTSGPGELAEEVRGHGLRHSTGELLACPMCLAQWVATALALGLVISPRITRLVLSTMTAVAGADFLQHLYVYLQQAAE
ncbi:MAG TPA: DUF1360 domain-containing protein [Jatrophihabitans sp.]|nr:DUF1360 domain-containing protein [Jatrophihabitans sp.]